MTGTCLPAAMPFSTLRLRTATTSSWRNATWRSTSGSSQLVRARGHDAVASKSPSCGSACQISSLTNGMKGWSRRRMPSSTFQATQRAARRLSRMDSRRAKADSSLAACAMRSRNPSESSSPQRGLAISRYQSQYSFQVKW